MPIINGRRITIPDSGVYGEELQRQAGQREGRRTVIKGNGTSFQTINPNHLYQGRELFDKHGNPVKITTIPDRTKGSFGRKRSEFSKQIITEQVYDVAEHLFKSGVDFDEDNADWMVVPQYYFPPNWSSVVRTAPLLIVFPTEYPEIPPIGCYLKADIECSPHGHLYANAYHEADKSPLERGWKWYCVYIPQGFWQPARVKRAGDWKHGDNLWQYFSLINESLASSD